MKSTGEVMGIDVNFIRAFAKSQLAAGVRLPLSGTAFISVKDGDKPAARAMAKSLIAIGFTVIATKGTAQYLADHGLPAKLALKVSEGRPHCVDQVLDGGIQLVINTTEGAKAISDSASIRRTALTAGVPYYTTIAGARAVIEAIAALSAGSSLEVAPLQSYFKVAF
jgi:carbamoyl-phosphate synthase large subunit